MRKIFFFFAAMMVAITMNAAIDAGAGALSAAIEAAASGATIELNTGDFTETAVFDIAKDITIKAAAGKAPVVKPMGIGIKNGSKVIFDGVKIDCSAATDHVIYANDDSADKSLTLEGCEVYGFTNNSSVIYTESKFDTCIINNCFLHNIEKSIMFYNGGSGKYVSITNSTLANITPTNESSYWTAVIYPTTATKIRIDNCTFYNCYSMGSYGTINLSASDVVVSNCILAMPADKDKRCIYNSGGDVMNCLTHHYTKSGTQGGIASGPTITGCDEISNVDPLFANAANSDFSLAENSPAEGAGVGGTHLGDPRWWHANWETAETVEVESVALDADELALDVNETSFLHATVLPAGASDPSVTWTSSNDAIATIVNGAVKGLAAGTVTITAKSNSDNSKSATCEVTVSDVLPSTDFAAPYFLKGTKAKLEGNIYVSEADSLNYKDKSVCGTATWKINALAGGVIEVTANYKTGSASGAELQIVILDADENQVGDTLKQGYYEHDGDRAISGSIIIPAAGVYTVKLLNAKAYSSAKLKGITLTKTANLPTAAIKGGWDGWASELAFTLSKDAKTASVKKTFNENDAYFFKILINGEYRGNGYWFKRDATTANITENGNDMKIIADYTGEYTFTWTFATNTLSVTFPAVPDPIFYVAGSFTDWETSKVKMTEEDGICTAAIQLAASTDTGFKILKIDYWGTKTWYGAQDADNHMTYESCTDWQLTTTNGSNINMQTTLEKDYTFTFNAATAKLSVDIPDPTTTSISNTAADGQTVKFIQNGMLFIQKNNHVYNVLGEVVK